MVDKSVYVQVDSLDNNGNRLLSEENGLLYMDENPF